MKILMNCLVKDKIETGFLQDSWRRRRHLNIYFRGYRSATEVDVLKRDGRGKLVAQTCSPNL
jgi:hypothetical protein